MRVLFFILLSAVLCNSSFASDCKNVQSSFNKLYKLLISKEFVTVASSVEGYEVTHTLSVGESFWGRKDKHSKSKYTISKIANDIVTIKYFYRFDARSFGDGIVECNGEIISGAQG